MFPDPRLTNMSLAADLAKGAAEAGAPPPSAA